MSLVSSSAFTMPPIALALVLAQGFPQPPTFLADLEPQVQAGGIEDSIPSFLASNGNLAFFAAQTPEFGRELWSSDGTVPGTRRLTDLSPGEADGLQAGTFNAVLPDGSLVFFASSPETGIELHRSDGTPEGTGLVVELVPGVSGQFAADLELLQGRAWFLGDDGIHGRELWSTDGTAEGTQMAEETIPGPGSAFPALLLTGAPRILGTEQGLYILRAVNDFGAEPVTEVWFTPDGFSAPTFVAAVPGLSSGRLVEHQGALIFNQVTSPSVFESESTWWTSDGTPAGTAPFGNPGATGGAWSSGPNLFLVFRETGDPQITLWVTPGDPSQLQIASQLSFSIGQASAFADFPAGSPLEGALLHPAPGSGPGSELVLTQPALGTSELIADFSSSPGLSGLEDFVLRGDQVYFLADTPATGTEIHRLDLNTLDVFLVEDHAIGSADLSFSAPVVATQGEPSRFLPTGPRLLAASSAFADGGQAVGEELLEVTLDEVNLFANLATDGPTFGSDPGEFARLGNQILFSADINPIGRELFISDGTSEGSSLLKDLFPSDDGNPEDLTALGDRMIFTAGRDPYSSGDHEPWVSDGTPEGTFRLANLQPGTSGSDPRQLTLHEGRVYFLATTSQHGAALWSTDGTSAGTVLVADPDPATGLVVVDGPRILGSTPNGLVFVANDGNSGAEPWITDGTPSGTELLIDLDPGSSGSSPRSPLVVGDRVFFTGTSPFTGRELYVSDGTASGTELVVDLAPGPDSSQTFPRAAVADGALLTALDGRLLLWSNGTESGTEILVQLPLSEPPFTGNAVSNGALAFFEQGDTPATRRPWISDGTALGTSILDLPSLAPSLQVLDWTGWIVGGDGRFVFEAQSPSGRQLWSTDGTLPGTVQLADSFPGAEWLPTGPGIQLGNQLLFAASDTTNGTELHSLPLLDTGSFGSLSLGSPCGFAPFVPNLDSLGEVRLGETFDLVTTEAVPSAPVLHFLSLDYLPGQLGACNPHLLAPVLLGSSVADSSGQSELGVAIPANPALAGVTLFAQGVSVHAGGPFLGLASLTQALELVFGE